MVTRPLPSQGPQSSQKPNQGQGPCHLSTFPPNPPIIAPNSENPLKTCVFKFGPVNHVIHGGDVSSVLVRDSPPPPPLPAVALCVFPK